MSCGLFADNSPTNNVPIIRVTTWRFEDIDMDVPADVKVITAEQIQRSQAQSIPDLLQQEANVRFRSSNGKGNSGELAMRGFGENSGLRVLVIVDGQKMNRADMGLLDWQQLPLDDIQSIEVIRGGQTVLYGNHALSGVIKITTKKGGDPKLKLKASGGSFGFEEYNAFYSGGTNRFFYDAGVTYQRDEGYRDNALSWNKNANASLGCWLGDTDTLIIRLSGGETYLQFPGPLIYTQFRDDPTQSSNLGDQFFKTKGMRIAPQWESERNWGSLQVNGGFNLRDIDFEMSGTSGKNKQQGFSLSPEARIGDEEGFISGGVDLFYDTLDFEGNQGAKLNFAEFSRITAGPFLFAQKPATETITLSGGARFEAARTSGENRQYDTFGVLIPEDSYDTSVTKKSWAGEISMNWQPSETVSLWVGYDRVYRYPALDEVASYQGFALSVPFNKNLDPETGNNFEIGTKYRDETWTASATLFYLTLDGEIAYDSSTNQNVNIGDTTRYGADLELAFKKKNYGISTLWSLVNATFDSGENDGKTVPLVPSVHGATILWAKPVKPLRLSATHTWTDRQYNGGNVENDSRQIKAYSLFGLRADLTCNEHLHIFLKINNLFDKQYASSAYFSGYYSGSGRGIYGGISLEF